MVSFIVFRAINFFQLYISDTRLRFPIVLLDIFVVEKIKSLTKLKYGRFYLQMFGFMFYVLFKKY